MQSRETTESTVSRRRFLTGALQLGGGLAVAGPALLVPAASAEAQRLVSKPSPADQKKLGDEAAKKIFQQYKEVNDGRSRHFNEIGQRLVAGLSANDRKTWDFRFHVLDSKEINAFALPGGAMFLFTGLYQLITSDDAVAGVTGHEMAHVYKEHWAKAYTKQQERAIGIGVLSSIFKIGRAGQTIAGLADNILSLKYSRGEESEADAEGLKDLVAARYNPQGMLDLFAVLEKASGGKSGGPEFLSDHPLTSDRINDTKKRIAALGPNRTFPKMTPLRYDALS